MFYTRTVAITFMFCSCIDNSKLTLFFRSPFFSKNTTKCWSRRKMVDVIRPPDGLQLQNITNIFKSNTSNRLAIKFSL